MPTEALFRTKLPECKVLVCSKIKRVRAITHREHSVKTDDRGHTFVAWTDYGRQFHAGEKDAFGRCWMTVEEAEFLVNDRANIQEMDDTNTPNYWFPTGAPVPQPINYQLPKFDLGPFAPYPERLADSAGVDPRQTAAAAERKQLEAQILAAHDAEQEQAASDALTKAGVAETAPRKAREIFPKDGVTAEPRVITARDAEAQGFTTESE